MARRIGAYVRQPPRRVYPRPARHGTFRSLACSPIATKASSCPTTRSSSKSCVTWSVPEPAGQRPGYLHGREEPVSNSGAHSADAAHPLHPNLQLLAQPGRALLRADHRQGHPSMARSPASNNSSSASGTSLSHTTPCASRSNGQPSQTRSCRSGIDFSHVSAGQDTSHPGE